jgi:hypothetical protein
MPGPEYYRKQAQLFASLALTSRDPAIIKRYNVFALEQLARAEQVERLTERMEAAVSSDGGSDTDRD